MKRHLLMLFSLAFLIAATSTSYATLALAWNESGYHDRGAATSPQMEKGQLVYVKHPNSHSRRWWHRHQRHWKDYDAPHAPELDPGLLGSGAALLAGSLLLLRERIRRE